mgnify:CR=1 FL=1
MQEERQQRTERTSRQRDTKQTGWQLVAVQSISCVAVILIVLVFKLIGGSAFSQLRDSFNKSIRSNSLLATLAAMIDVPDEKNEDDSSVTQSSTQESQSNETTSTQNSSSDPSSTASETNTTQTSETSASTTSAVSSSTTAVATGGQDISVQGKVEYAPAGASFVPLKVNRLAIQPLESGKVTSLFGYRKNPITGIESFHQGLDIAVERGTPIAAMFFGVVNEIGSNAGYGNYIKIYHGNGIEVLYAHCSEILANEGAAIRAGEIVAHAGSTGDSTGPHVHIEVTLDGIAFDPAGIVDTGYYD